MRKFLGIAISIFLALGCAPRTNVKSPDGSICLEFSLSDKGQPEYVVSACGETFIGKSVLGMETSTPANLKSGFSLKSSRVKRHSERWTQPWGENKEMLDEHRELEVKLANDDCCLTLRFRAFDDGVGREALLLEVRPQGRATMVQDELFNGVKDRGLRPAEKGKLPG